MITYKNNSLFCDNISLFRLIRLIVLLFVFKYLYLQVQLLTKIIYLWNKWVFFVYSFQKKGNYYNWLKIYRLCWSVVNDLWFCRLYGRVNYGKYLWRTVNSEHIKFYHFEFWRHSWEGDICLDCSGYDCFALGFNLYALRKAYRSGEQSAKVMALRKTINQVLFSITLLVMVFTKVFILHS